jgi:hypothetical protein
VADRRVVAADSSAFLPYAQRRGRHGSPGRDSDHKKVGILQSFTLVIAAGILILLGTWNNIQLQHSDKDF